VNKVFSLYLISLLFFGCAKQAVNLNESGAAYLLESKAQIRSSNETNSVNIEIALLPQKAARFEITATLGVGVATVLMTPQEITYVLHSTKEFYRGPFHEKTLYPIFKKNIDPQILWRIIHNQSPASAKIKCELDADKRPLSCRDSEGYTVKWVYEEPPRRRIELKSDNFEMKWLFTSQSYLGDYQNETFVLKKPDSYKEIIIR